MTFDPSKLLESEGKLSAAEIQNILDISWSHDFDCVCDACLSGWALVGPDGMRPGDYGPFTREQVNERQRKLGLAETE